MIIYDDFYLNGFSKIDKGEAGAVFVHYAEERKDDREPEIVEAPLYYGGANTANYTISIPKPRARVISACAIVTRTSKNCYQATVYDERRIERFTAETLNGLRKTVSEFFKNVI